MSSTALLAPPAPLPLAPIPLPSELTLPLLLRVRLARLDDHRRSTRPSLTLVPPLLVAERTAPPAPPPPGAEVRQLLAGVLEVLDGRRPATQLEDVVPPDDQRILLRQARSGGPGPRTLRSIHLTRTTPAAVDLCARIDHGRRSLAMTGRLELHGDRWRIALLAMV
jgi:hypothetical protein